MVDLTMQITKECKLDGEINHSETACLNTASSIPEIGDRVRAEENCNTLDAHVKVAREAPPRAATVRHLRVTYNK